MDKLWQVVCFCVYVCVYFCHNRPAIVTFENEQFHQSSTHGVDRLKVKLSDMIVEWIGGESIIRKTCCLRHLRKHPLRTSTGWANTKSNTTITKSQTIFHFVFFFLIFFLSLCGGGGHTTDPFKTALSLCLIFNARFDALPGLLDTWLKSAALYKARILT